MITMPALDAAFYDLMMETSGAMSGAMRAARARAGDQETPPPLIQLRGGYAESPGWFLVQAAEFDPEPLTVTNLRVRDVYASEGIVRALLELLASERHLEHDGQGAYSLAPAGQAVLDRVRQRQQRLLADLSPLPAGEIAQIADWLGRLMDASRKCAVPPGAWCLAHSRNRAPDADARPLVQILHYLQDVNAFRDDAHMAAWQPLGVGGDAWEAFATVCAGEADSVDAVFEQLAHRGYCRGEYAAALQDLVRRGWLAEGGVAGSYLVTETGRAVRNQIEARTDQYFYAPWSCLEEREIGALHAALIRLRDGLIAISGQG